MALSDGGFIRVCVHMFGALLPFVMCHVVAEAGVPTRLR